MATRNLDVTVDPINLVTTHGLVVGVTYSLQCIDPNARVFIRTAAVKPTGGALRGFTIGPFEDATITPVSGLGVWVWTDKSDGGKAVIDESA